MVVAQTIIVVGEISFVDIAIGDVDQALHSAKNVVTLEVIEITCNTLGLYLKNNTALSIFS